MVNYLIKDFVYLFISFVNIFINFSQDYSGPQPFNLDSILLREA